MEFCNWIIYLDIQNRILRLCWSRGLFGEGDPGSLVGSRGGSRLKFKTVDYFKIRIKGRVLGTHSSNQNLYNSYSENLCIVFPIFLKSSFIKTTFR